MDAVYQHPDGPSLAYNENQLSAHDGFGNIIVLPIGKAGLIELAAELAAIGNACTGVKNERLSPIVHAFEFQTEKWWGDEWRHDEPSFIDLECADANVMPNAPMVVYLRPECNPKEAAKMLHDLADYLSSDELQLRPLVMPKNDRFDNFIYESKEVREANRQIQELEKQISAIRQAVPETDLPF